MDIKQVGSIVTQMPSVGLTDKTQENKSVFSDLYKSAINMLEQTNTLQKEADQASLDFALGKVDNVHDVMIAQEKASIALQYTVQIRDKILEAYNEIMRIQL